MAVFKSSDMMIDIKIRKYIVKYGDDPLDVKKKPKVELVETNEKNSLSLVEAIKHLVELLK